MTEFLKLLFDLSLYDTVFGYYLTLAVGDAPSAALYLALAGSILLDSLLRARRLYENKARPLRFLPLCLPLLALLFRPSLPQLVHALPIWAYLGFSMAKDRVETRYADFRAHSFLGLRMLLLLVFGLFFPGRVSAAITGAIPYLVAMLACGVCLLRMLREHRPDGLRQGIYMALFMLLCALLTVGKAPQLLARGLGLLYRSLIAPLLLVIAAVLGMLIYLPFSFFSWLFSPLREEQEPPQFDLQEAAEALGLERQYETYAADLRWLKVLLIALAAAVLLFVLYRLFRRLLGSRASGDAASPWLERETDRGAAGLRMRKPGVLRPRDPRLAVRWDYAHFIAECRRRGVPVKEGMTASELAAVSAAVFPGADPAAFTAVYLPARYHASGQVTAEDARRSGELWRALKAADAPSDLRRRKKSR